MGELLQIAPAANFLAILATVIGFIYSIIKISMRVGALELKVDTMWGFQMRRALSETVTTGIGTTNSPIIISKDAIKKMETMREALERWYAAVPMHARRGDASLLLAIEEKFGDDILHHVCFPVGLSYGACLIVALYIAKGGAADDDMIINIDLAVSKDRH